MMCITVVYRAFVPVWVQKYHSNYSCIHLSSSVLVGSSETQSLSSKGVRYVLHFKFWMYPHNKFLHMKKGRFFIRKSS